MKKILNTLFLLLFFIVTSKGQLNLLYYSESNISESFTSSAVLADCLNDLAKHLSEDIKKSAYAFEEVIRTENGLKAWETLINHPNLRIDVNILSKAQSVLAKGHISSADITEILRVNAGLGNRAEAVGKLLDDLNYFEGFKNSPGFQTTLNKLKADWYNGAGADGANYVLDLMKNLQSEFPFSTTNFEVNYTALGRRYDAVVDGTPKKFYEFKSYSSVPPPDFAEQFIKDLTNPDITDLGQLKWYFDSAKNPPNFEANMKAAIKNLKNDDLVDMLPKFGATTPAQLKTIIETNFSKVFALK